MTIKMALCGDIVSVRATIRGVRLNAPYLQDSNEELTGVIVEIAKAWGLAVLFDGRRE
ncbi:MULTISPECIES: hypothetical protein [unclassified Mesorhizobium]|uniref:hypothetical protein n=1 Tax=unclassified Mesorhizobium TaxID=325217 RepID=UPI001FE1D363|nr:MULTISPECIES: hypothetical protein [unclassified Mesorhizobium]